MRVLLFIVRCDYKAHGGWLFNSGTVLLLEVPYCTYTFTVFAENRTGAVDRLVTGSLAGDRSGRGHPVPHSVTH